MTRWQQCALGIVIIAIIGAVVSIVHHSATATVRIEAAQIISSITLDENQLVISHADIEAAYNSHRDKTFILGRFCVFSNQHSRAGQKIAFIGLQGDPILGFVMRGTGDIAAERIPYTHKINQQIGFSSDGLARPIVLLGGSRSRGCGQAEVLSIIVSAKDLLKAKAGVYTLHIAVTNSV